MLYGLLYLCTVRICCVSQLAHKHPVILWNVLMSCLHFLYSRVPLQPPCPPHPHRLAIINGMKVGGWCLNRRCPRRCWVNEASWENAKKRLDVDKFRESLFRVSVCICVKKRHKISHRPFTCDCCWSICITVFINQLCQDSLSPVHLITNCVTSCANRVE